MNLRRFNMKLHVTITMLFIIFTIPVTIIIIATNYQSNKVIAAENSERFIKQSVQENINSVTNLFNPMLGNIGAFATLMKDRPEYFQDNSSADYLYQIVSSNEAVYAAYAGFEDGQFRQVWRAIKNKKVFGQDAPDAAQFVSRFIKDDGHKRVDYYAMYGAWREPLKDFSGPATYDARKRDYYKEAIQKTGPHISDPYIFASSGVLGITLTAQIPDARGGAPVGVAAIDLTLDTLCRFLGEHRVTEHSITLIADASGALVAHPDYAADPLTRPEGLARSPLAKLGDTRLTTALLERERLHSDRFVFQVGPDRDEYIAVFSPFPKDFNKPWELITLAPTDDFVGQINATNRHLLIFGLVAFVVQIMLIYRLSRSISMPLETLVGQVTDIRNFKFSDGVRTRSHVSEVKLLFDAIDMLEKTISSFTSYVPRGLVQELLGSGISAKLGVESRYLTVLFTDLEGFSTLSESEPSQQLLRRVSDYFSVVTRAIEAERGTVDKFIGDAVMAFWGAPRQQSNHAYHACVAAVRSQRQMVTLNAQWVGAGLSPLNVRIGIHCDSVLVGNIGSKDRLSYTVMGDGVNISARLEGINKEWGTRTCVSHYVFREAGDRLWLRPIDTVTVKGRKGEFLIYELVAVRDGDQEVSATPEEMELCRKTTAAYTLYAAAHYAEAAAAYQDVLDEFPQDQVARTLLAKCLAKINTTALFSA